jgi:serine/threonine protein kinase
VDTAWESAGELIDGRFELLEQLGAGGMGTVWRARDTALHRDVALKEVSFHDPAMPFSDPIAVQVMRERTLREARALARLHHPNVVAIYHIVDSPEVRHPWLVMELISGSSLAERLKHGPLAPLETVRIGRGVLAALRAAHAADIQHRDVKPANVLLRPDGTPVLTDFGIAILRESVGLTTTGSLIGSPEYIAPERIRGEEGDPASDLWSLALMLYVAIEGHNPLHRGTAMATLAAALDAHIPPPTQAGPLAPALSATLVRDPSARPDAAQLEQMFTDAENILLGEAPSGRTVPSGAPSAPKEPSYPETPTVKDRVNNSRSRAFTAGVALIAVLGAVGALVYTLHDTHGSDTASRGALNGSTTQITTPGRAQSAGDPAARISTTATTHAGPGTTGNPLTPTGGRAAGGPGQSPGPALGLGPGVGGPTAVAATPGSTAAPKSGGLGAGFDVEAQDNTTGVLWNVEQVGKHDTRAAMAPHSSPASALQPGAGFQMVWHGSNDHLWISSAHGSVDDGVLMAQNTSPSLVAFADGNWEAAVQGPDNKLWVTGTKYGTSGPGAAMAADTSPSVAVDPTSPDAFRVAWHGSNGHAWVDGGGQPATDLGVTMAAGASPSLVVLPNNGFEVIYEDPTFHVAMAGTDGNRVSGAAMAPNTNPVAAIWPTDPTTFQIVWQGSNGDVFTSGETGGVDLGLAMSSDSSPSLMEFSGGGYEIAFKGRSGDAWVTGNAGTSDTGITVAANSSPSIVALP